MASTSKKVGRRLAPVLAVIFGIGALAAPAALAFTSDESVTVGTGYTRQPSEIICFGGGGCTSDWNHNLKAGSCTKTAYQRIRFQRDLLPDETVRNHDNFTGCDVWGWSFHQEQSHAHHQDGKVTSGTGDMRFTVS